MLTAGSRVVFAEKMTTSGFKTYSGKRMFPDSGEPDCQPAHTGLLLLDWETGNMLQLTGRAQIVWDAQAARSRPRAERLVQVAVDAV